MQQQAVVYTDTWLIAHAAHHETDGPDHPLRLASVHEAVQRCNYAWQLGFMHTLLCCWVVESSY